MALSLGGVLLLAGCGEEKPTRPAPAGAGDPAVGRQIYLAQCTMCHGSDPGQRGPVGPPIKGTSRELLESKVLRGAYPPGYTPKQDTAVMPPMPQLAPNVGDLAAYLR